MNYTKTTATESSFVSTVFLWMFAALGITALTAYLFASTPSLMMMMFSEKGLNIFGWIVMLAPIIIVFVMSARVNKMSVQTMTMLYIVYSILMGMSLSFIFLAYTGASIMKTFAICSAMFGIMALVGYTTKTDLTKFGGILMMALIGIIVASLVNFFMHSERLEYIISFVGVLIFTGLTAYDVQKIKEIGNNGIAQGDTMAKITIFAALSLYLDFINLFLYLLRFFGKRN